MLVGSSVTNSAIESNKHVAAAFHCSEKHMITRACDSEKHMITRAGCTVVQRLALLRTADLTVFVLDSTRRTCITAVTAADH